MRASLKLLTHYLAPGVLIVLAAISVGLFVVRAETSISYSLADRGAVSLVTRGGAGSAIIGYARIQPDAANATPAGVAIFGFRQNGVLVSEASVPSTKLIQSGRIYAEVNGPVNTGIAIANPGPQTATVQFYFTNSAGVDFAMGATAIPANAQISSFLDQSPFNSGSSVTGTFTFNSSSPVAVTALRGLTNEQNQFLITTLPVIDLAAPSTGSTIASHFADGSGWTTQVVLVNPGDSAISGAVQFFSQGTPAVAGEPLSLTVNGQAGTIFNYTVQRRSSLRLQTSGASSGTLSGSIRVTPATIQAAPSAFVIFSKKTGSVTVSEASVTASRPASALRLYAEVSGAPSSIRTGVAIANPSSTPITVNLEVTTGLIGNSPILTAAATIPANGQIAKFLDEIQGFESLPRPFKGVFRVATSFAGGITAIGLRSRINERGDFLITTTPPVEETIPVSTAEAFFPHFVDNGGYTTEFILYSLSAGAQSTGQIRMIGQNGQPRDVAFTSLADLELVQTGSTSCSGSGTTCNPPPAYVITVENKGPSPAPNVTITDTLPTDVYSDLVVGTVRTVSSSQGSCSPANAGRFSCSLGLLPVGVKAIVNLSLNIDDTVIGRKFVNKASVGSNDIVDPVPANNSEDWIANWFDGPRSNLEILQMTANPNPVTRGNPVTLNIVFRNGGPSTATNLKVTTTGLIGVVSALPTKGTCSIAATNVVCNIGTLVRNTQGTVTIVFVPPTAGSRIITAEIESSEGFPKTQPVTVIAN